MNDLSNQNSGTSVYSHEVKDEHRQAVIYLTTGSYREAEELFIELIRKNPDLSEAHLNLGNALFYQHRLDEAMNSWKKALSLDSSQVNCYINIGKAFYSLQKYDDAINHWIIAITMAPNHSATLMNLGAAYEKLGDLSTAYKYYEEFLALKDPSMVNEFRTVYAKIANLKKIAMHNLKIGITYQKKEYFKNALLAYKESIKSYPNFAKAHLNMGSICYILEKYDYAVNYWLNSIKLDSQYSKTYCNVAVAYDKQSKYSYAYCYYKRYVELENSKNKEIIDIKKRMDALFLHFSKKSSFRQEHLEKAKKFYDAKSYYQSLIEYENYVFVFPEGHSEVDRKIQELRDNLNPKLKAANTAFEIGETCFAQQKYDKAVEAYKRYLQFDPMGKYKHQATQKMVECGKLMSRAISAFVSSNT
jgi:superkiller protein 3